MKTRPNSKKMFSTNDKLSLVRETVARRNGELLNESDMRKILGGVHTSCGVPNTCGWSNDE